MPYVGDFTPRNPGELRTFSYDALGKNGAPGDLAPGDFLVSVTTTLTAFPAGTDPAAATLLADAPQILTGAAGVASVVAQQIGTNPSNVAGFQTTVTYYIWKISAVTNAGDKPIWDVHLPVYPIS